MTVTFWKSKEPMTAFFNGDILKEIEADLDPSIFTKLPEHTEYIVTK